MGLFTAMKLAHLTASFIVLPRIQPDIDMFAEFVRPKVSWALLLSADGCLRWLSRLFGHETSLSPAVSPRSDQELWLSALLLHPILRSMAYAADGNFAQAPRYVLFFKGGAFYPSKTNPTSLTALQGTPIAPLQAHSDDIILFKNMNIHGGSPKSDGYKEEHAAGVIGCSTGNSYKYFKNDAYFAYTDNESIDIRIANHYQHDRT